MSVTQRLGLGLGAIVGILIAVFAVLVLGGLCSAAWEIRREKRAGLVPTRPAWDGSRKGRYRRSVRDAVSTARGLWKGLREPVAADDICPECEGPLVTMDGQIVCVADLNGDPIAESLHDAFSGVSWEVRHEPGSGPHGYSDAHMDAR